MIPDDIVYGVRPGDINEELRYSLRSLAKNVPHKRVWIVGDMPSWVRGTEFIPGNRWGDKWRNLPDNLLIAATSIPAREVLVMNDDFFINRPVTGIPWMRRPGTLVDHSNSVSPGEWRSSLRNTLRQLISMGFPEPVSYELHVPVIMRTDLLAETCRQILATPFSVPPQWRTMYGNMYRVVARISRDGKSRHRTSKLFLSTEDFWWAGSQTAAWLRERFPEPSPYEEPNYNVWREVPWRARFRNLKYPALRFYSNGIPFKFIGGRLMAEGDLAMAVRAHAINFPHMGIYEVDTDDRKLDMQAFLSVPKELS